MSENSKGQVNLSMNPRIERDREMILKARAQGKGALAGAFVRLSGPGWLQSAITLGGGSLSSSLYLGVLGGFCFLWLQPLAMAAGIIMLSAIAYVTLSTGERPLRAINKHVNPVLGWGWLFASMAANLVWSMPQYALATASFQQNLFPGVFGEAVMPDPYGKLVVGAIILCITLSVGMLYSIGGRGVKAFEIAVKCLVGTTVVCFMATVIKLTTTGQISWGAIGRGFIPSLHLLSEPVDAFKQHIAAVPSQFQDFWNEVIVSKQRDVMISAAATAVGINMTFLFPYSMLRKGWDRDFRGLAIFDLSTGLFFPFLMATSCVVIAAASQFHAAPAAGFLPIEPGETLNAQGQVVDAEGNVVAPAANLVGPYEGFLKDRATYQLRQEMGAESFATFSAEAQAERVKALVAELPEADRRMAAMLTTRDAFNLAGSLAPLVGSRFSQYVFGLGVLGMAMGAATMLMLINGLCFCELLNKPAKGTPQRIGMLMVGVGILGPLFWGQAKMWIAIPTSIFAMCLLPLAYFSFLFLMNQKSLMGENIPKGGSRVLWNALMGISATLAAGASAYSLWSNIRWLGVVIVVVFTVLVVVVHLVRQKPESHA
ncbi:MAG TPA: divalent metal cation transporter [Candidatus Hydrogenedentes bacterium]|nr:divalent metal cation transporter [Candidatus Hydrogenedentota bacterium]HPG67916.1 divalent metal cation transporter [Candidatus Hydrogenedentota bacterium]